MFKVDNKNNLGKPVVRSFKLYDSICTQLKKSTIKVGLSFFDHNDVFIDKESHDIALDYCQTPSKLYQFNF